MTNAEKYKEVFGFEPEMKSCPTHCCIQCPCCEHVNGKDICNMDTRMWWMSDFEEV